MYKPPFTRTRISAGQTVIHFRNGAEYSIIHPGDGCSQFSIKGLKFPHFWSCVAFSARIEGVCLNPPGLKGVTAGDIADFVSETHSYYCATSEAYPLLSSADQYEVIKIEARLSNNGFSDKQSGQLYLYFCFELGVDDL